MLLVPVYGTKLTIKILSLFYYKNNEQIYAIFQIKEIKLNLQNVEACVVSIIYLIKFTY